MKNTSHILYQKIVENMNEAMALNDEHARIVYANPKYCRLTGYTLAEIIGRQEYDFLDSETRLKVISVNKNERKKGLSSAYEGYIRTKFGEKIPVFISGSPMPNGGTMGIFTDVREIQKKEKKEKILTHALQHTAEIILLFDPEGKIELWNQGATVSFGRKKNEMEGRDLSIIFGKADIAKIRTHSRVLQNIEVTGQHKNKAYFTISATITPIRHRKKVTAYLFIGRDITHQMKFEEELALKYQKIKDAYNQFGTVRRQMDYVFELIELCRHENNRQMLADFVVNSIAMLTRVDACMLRIYQPQTKKLEMVSAFGLHNDWWGLRHISYHNSLTEKAAKLGHPLKVIDIFKEPKYTSAALAKKNNFTSLLLIPLFYKSHFIGAISLYTKPDKKLEIFENEFIEQYAKLAEIALGTAFNF